MKRSELRIIIKEEYSKLNEKIMGGVIADLIKDLKSKNRKIADAAMQKHSDFSAQGSYTDKQFDAIIPALIVYDKNRKGLKEDRFAPTSFTVQKIDKFLKGLSDDRGKKLTYRFTKTSNGVEIDIYGNFKGE